MEEVVFVYILKMSRFVKYVGITNDLDRRIKEHRQNKKGFTSKFKEKEYIFIYKCENRKKARKLEMLIKRQGARIFMLRNENSLKGD